MIKISENLYQGNLQDALETAKLGKSDCIVWLSQEIPRELSHESKVPVFHFPLKDGKGNSDLSINVVLDTIAYLTLEDRTLVACRAGISRSPTIITGFLFRYDINNKFRTFSYALQLVKARVKEFQPEQNFLKTVERVSKTYYKRGDRET